MKKILLLICLGITTVAFSQTTKDTTKTKETNADKVFTTVQSEAEFTGGKLGWQEYLQKNLKADIPEKNKAPVGKYSVIVEFVIATDGTISSAKALNNPGYGTAEEAERVIKDAPKWKPAIINNRAIIYRAKQQIVFKVNKA